MNGKWHQHTRGLFPPAIKSLPHNAMFSTQCLNALQTRFFSPQKCRAFSAHFPPVFPYTIRIYQAPSTFK